MLVEAQGPAHDEDTGGFEYLEYPTHKIVPNPETSCGQCHDRAVKTWQRTVHFKTFEELYGRSRAQEIVEKMGGRSIKRSKICTQCHYTMRAREEGGRETAIMGVSCQRCHGAALDWLNLHADTVAEPERAKRLAACEPLGMRPTHKLYELATSCFQCHTVPIEELVNVGGHHAGSEFELVAWSQGEVRHNFLPLPDEAANKERSPEYLRRLFVIGKLLELEWSLRGLAEVTGPGAYRTAMHARAAAAKEGVEKLNSSSLAEVLEAVPDTSSSDRTAFKQAAETIGAFAKKLSDDDFAGFDFGQAIDQLPARSEYKGTVFGN